MHSSGCIVPVYVSLITNAAYSKKESKGACIFYKCFCCLEKTTFSRKRTLVSTGKKNCHVLFFNTVKTRSSFPQRLVINQVFLKNSSFRKALLLIPYKRRSVLFQKRGFLQGESRKDEHLQQMVNLAILARNHLSSSFFHTKILGRCV